MGTEGDDLAKSPSLSASPKLDQDPIAAYRFAILSRRFPDTITWRYLDLLVDLVYVEAFHHSCTVAFIYHLAS